jgi:hypothetical protein
MRRLVLTLALFLFATTLQAQQLVTIVPSRTSGITAVTTTVATVTLPPSVDAPMMNVLINITAGGTATGTMQLWIEDSADGGTTWNDVISSNTFALGAAAVTQAFFVQGGIASTATSGAAQAVETLAAGTTRQGVYSPLMRVREKITSPSGSPVGATYTITAVVR